jgi:type III secretion protein R
VLSLLRNALGLQQVPPNVVINGLAIVLSIYVMYPVILDTTAAVNGLPPVTTSASGTQGATLPAAGAGAAAATQPAPATGTSQQPAGPPPSPTRAPDDPAPASPAAADAQAAEAAAQGAAPAARGPLFANVQGSPDATPVAASPAPAPGSTAARTTVMVPARTTPISQLSLTGGGKFDMNRLMAMVDAGKEPLRKFLIQHSSDAERAFFLRSAQRLLPPASRGEITVNDFIVVVPAFTVSELTAAFQIGFLIYLPFLIIDLVVSNILLALGMMMMSPTTVSLPFKLLLFVLIDGWAKLVHGLVLTYGT